MTEEQFKEITKWQSETFPDATDLSKLHHLKDEVDELIEDVECNNLARRLEFADCILLIFGSASANGMSYEDICNAVDEKMEINKARKWGKPDKNGVVNHVK